MRLALRVEFRDSGCQALHERLELHLDHLVGGLDGLELGVQGGQRSCEPCGLIPHPPGHSVDGHGESVQGCARLGRAIFDILRSVRGHLLIMRKEALAQLLLSFLNRLKSRRAEMIEGEHCLIKLSADLARGFGQILPRRLLHLDQDPDASD